MKRVNKKTLYLMLLVVICLLGIVIVPTYAKFASSFVTGEDIVGLNLSFNIGISNMEEYEEIIVPAGGSEKFNVEITNSTGSTAYYGVWYKMVNPSTLGSDIQIGRLSGTSVTTSGSINTSGSTTVTLAIVNGSTSDITVNIGVASSSASVNNIEYLGGKYLVTGDVEIPATPTATDDIINLYNDGSAINTVYIGGSSSNPQVSLNATQGIMLDNNGDYRYYGANPNNYVAFNGEVWRIIGVFNNVDDGTGKKETRMKIIRNDSIGNYSYDSSSGINGNGVNDWSQADLNTELNTLYYNSTSGTCYNGQSNASTTCDFSSTGLGSEAQSMIGDAVFHLGGSSEYDGLYADDYYTFERGTTVYGSNATTWTGKIGLMYPSDYVYATDLSVCTSNGYGYNGSSNCYGKDWLISSTVQNTIAPTSSAASYVFVVISSGRVHYVNSFAYLAHGVRPAVYLKSNVAIASGVGTSDNPYQLELT